MLEANLGTNLAKNTGNNSFRQADRDVNQMCSPKINIEQTVLTINQHDRGPSLSICLDI